jgi:hypothetical protein
VLSYNHSVTYLRTVLSWGMAYRVGATPTPNSLKPVVPDVTKVRPKLADRPPIRRPKIAAVRRPTVVHPRQVPTHVRLTGTHSPRRTAPVTSVSAGPSASATPTESVTPTPSPTSTPTPSATSVDSPTPMATLSASKP